MRTSTARRAVVLAAVAAFGMGAVTDGAASAATSPSPTTSVPRTRDPLRWPFARTSIWNTPIGTKARYVPAKIQNALFGVAVDWFVVTRGSDPAVPVYLPGSSDEGRCTGRRRQAPVPSQARRRQHLPRSFLLPAPGPDVASPSPQPARTPLGTSAATARCTPGRAPPS